MMFLYVAFMFVMAGIVTGLFFLFKWLMKGEENGTQKETTPKEESRKVSSSSADGSSKRSSTSEIR
jgi:hypothetical protein